MRMWRNGKRTVLRRLWGKPLEVLVLLSAPNMPKWSSQTVKATVLETVSLVGSNPSFGTKFIPHGDDKPSMEVVWT